MASFLPSALGSIIGRAPVRERGRVPQVLLQRVARAGGVVSSARVEDAAVVLLERGRLAEQRPLQSLVPLHHAAQLLREAALSRAIGRAEQDLVELSVEVS